VRLEATPSQTGLLKEFCSSLLDRLCAVARVESILKFMRIPFRLSLAGCVFRLLLILLFFLPFLATLQSQTAAPVDPKTIPVIDAGIGSCSADFTITDSAGAPVYSASIKVHIAYGVMSLHKMDLEVGTNADGKARFTGLPDKTKQGLFFRVSEGDREGSAFDDPAKTCKAVFATPLEKKSK
jgi:hypothetical protein